MSTPPKPAKSTPALPLVPDVHHALRVRAAVENKGIKELGDALLREALAPEIEQIKKAAGSAA